VIHVASIDDEGVASLASGRLFNNVVTVDNNGLFSYNFALSLKEVYLVFGEASAVVYASTLDYKVYATAIFTLLTDSSPPLALPSNIPLLFVSSVDLESGEKLRITGTNYPPNTNLIIRLTPEENDILLRVNEKKFDKFSTDAEGKLNIQLTMSKDEIGSVFDTGKIQVQIATADNQIEKSFNVWVSL
jgi:hypothetical protein